jgi:chromosome partitioning protein
MIISIANQKGGVGKTTTAINLAAALAMRGKKTLLIDLDPQGNSSMSYLDIRVAQKSMYDVFVDKDTSLADVILPASQPNLSIAPARIALAKLESRLVGELDAPFKLKDELERVNGQYQNVVIDCPPALGLLTVNGLVASDWAIVSAEAQYFALQGVQGALDVVEQAKEFYNPDLELAGVLMNIADMRTVHSREAYDTLAEHFPDTVFKTVIRSSIAYAESAEKARSILDHRPDLGADYLALADELLKRIGLDAPRRKLRPLIAAAG